MPILQYDSSFYLAGDKRPVPSDRQPAFLGLEQIDGFLEADGIDRAFGLFLGLRDRSQIIGGGCNRIAGGTGFRFGSVLFAATEKKQAGHQDQKGISFHH